MNIASIYTDVIELPAAKKLFDTIQKVGKSGSWSSWSGGGGSETDCEIEKIDHQDLEFLLLPDYCTSFLINSLDDMCLKSGEIPDSLFLGGDDWFPPDFGDSGEIRFYVIPKGFNQAVMLSFSKRSGMRFLGHSYDRCLEIEISTGDRLDLISRDEISTPENRADADDLMQLWRAIPLPDEQAEGFIEAIYSDQKNRFLFEPESIPQFSQIIRRAIQGLVSESPIGRYYVWAMVIVGAQASFEGKSYDTTQVSRELLARIFKENVFPSYEISYSYLGPRSWKVREKSRKKLKEPEHEQLGILALENGAVAQVSLGIEKEGYVFYLNFDNDDDLIKFYHSKLFQKTQWHSGAE